MADVAMEASDIKGLYSTEVLNVQVHAFVLYAHVHCSYVLILGLEGEVDYL